MDDNYCAPLAAILRKAQGCIDRDTDELIDVGGEVSKLRRICDSQRATISRLRDALLRYAYHEEDCAAVDRGLSNCDCGYDELIKTLEDRNP